jgi:hypothetical protein
MRARCAALGERTSTNNGGKSGLGKVFVGLTLPIAESKMPANGAAR